MINQDAHSFAITVVRLGLLRIAPENHCFPGRKGAAGGEVIIDSRAASAQPLLRTVLLGALMVEISTFPESAVIAGLRSSGLVFGAQLAVFAGRKFVTVWPEGARSSGLQRAVEGDVSGQDVVLFDNCLDSGESLKLAAKRIEESQGRVVGAMLIGAYRNPVNFKFPVNPLFTISQLLHAARDVGMISSARLQHLFQ